MSQKTDETLGTQKECFIVVTGTFFLDLVNILVCGISIEMCPIPGGPHDMILL